MSDLIFVVCALICVISAIAATLNPRTPMYSVLFMLPFFIGLAIIFVQLSAPFVAAMQIAIYGGAILVLFLFVIMLLNLRSKSPHPDEKVTGWWIAALLVGCLTGCVGVFASLTGRQAAAMAFSETEADGFGSAGAIGTTLFRDLALPFELVSLLILVALIGTVMLSKKNL